ncbi:bifunctional hydroxymethylpyrimidine kinase/phosphomethylpyrimidine kinase [Sedimentitalea todarodis]|uniref:hydroxymethylpyrimidine kinase n=1 Tax=Sedimentitalea todarodis TaxID=1631240 RepID=A0ABU3VE92_9RHOB|nr:bifunctional hydroxymethylpyrimidine kinase/phosphomethylpyrimidine kinase [Sedimentitalea todarodis]MDU9004508.1 bifunctional hydroxymethylpyrimidine kinase/phosphomethylpyrimidine kinase [Sedimentitalea todarodis]
MIPNVLSIAGSDPSGGAGIQADIKTISANGAFAMAAITALTAQNTQGVTGIHFVPPDFVQSQIGTVFADIRVDAVKIGMIANADIAAAVARSLQRQPGVPIVLDPVMIAKGGAALLHPDAVITLRDTLLPMATLLTPNLPEAAHLLGTSAATTREEMFDQGAALCALGPQAVLMKGGHLAGPESPDCLVTDRDVMWFEAARTQTSNTHGTGCTLSSALAAQLARGKTPAAATAVAKSYVANAIANAGALSVGTGQGPTHHFAALYSN